MRLEEEKQGLGISNRQKPRAEDKLYESLGKVTKSLQNIKV